MGEVIEPLRLSFDVACSAAHAFVVWTDRIDAWWPRDHTATNDPRSVIRLEKRVGGRLFEVTPVRACSHFPRRLVFAASSGTSRRIPKSRRSGAK